MSTSTTPPRYQVPTLLRDLVLLDMLELTGSTVATAQLLHLSQPTVSRRARQVVKQLGLLPRSGRVPGQRFTTPPWLQLLRQGVNRHRHDCGVLRLGGNPAIEAALDPLGWVEWVPLPTKQRQHWPTLLELELLDGLVVQAPPASGTFQPQHARCMALSPASGAGLWLLLRSEPLVLSLAERYASALSGSAEA